MIAFWRHLQTMAKAQLFNGGYLAGPAVRPERDTQPAPAATAPRERPANHDSRLPHAPMAACR